MVRAGDPDEVAAEVLQLGSLPSHLTSLALMPRVYVVHLASRGWVGRRCRRRRRVVPTRRSAAAAAYRRPPEPKGGKGEARPPRRRRSRRRRRRRRARWGCRRRRGERRRRVFARRGERARAVGGLALGAGLPARPFGTERPVDGVGLQPPHSSEAAGKLHALVGSLRKGGGFATPGGGARLIAGSRAASSRGCLAMGTTRSACRCRGGGEGAERALREIL